MTIATLTPLPSGAVRLRVYRLSRGRRWLCYDLTAPLGEVLEELREIARPPPTAWWLAPAPRVTSDG